MSKAFEEEFDVPAAAIDDNGHVNNVEYVRWMNDAAVRHFAAAGGVPVLQRLGMTWVARSHHVEYLRPALPGDRVQIRTWVEDFRRVMSLRKYEVTRANDGTVLAKGQTEWVLIDTTSGRPRSIPDELKALFLGGV